MNLDAHSAPLAGVPTLSPTSPSPAIQGPSAAPPAPSRRQLLRLASAAPAMALVALLPGVAVAEPVSVEESSMNAISPIAAAPVTAGPAFDDPAAEQARLARGAANKARLRCLRASFRRSSVADLARIYDAITAAMEAMLGILNQPRTSDAAVNWIDKETGRLSWMAQAIAEEMADRPPPPEEEEWDRCNWGQTIIDWYTRHVGEEPLVSTIAQQILTARGLA